MAADQMVAAFFQPTAAAIESHDLPPLLLSQSQQEAYDLITQAMLLSDKQSDRAKKSGRWNATCQRMVTIRTNLGLLRDLIKSPGASTRSSLAMLKNAIDLRDSSISAAVVAYRQKFGEDKDVVSAEHAQLEDLINRGTDAANKFLVEETIKVAAGE